MCAEKSYLWTTSGTGDGTGSGYTENDIFQVFRSFVRTANQGGVCPDVLNELAPNGTATPVTINTGQAIVYGIPYFNSASVSVTIPTPASLTRVDYIVLRASWAAQTVRVTRIAGTEGAGAPSLTQTAGTTWDIPLATASITTGGIITITDMREWAIGVGDLAIDSTKLAANAVTNAKLATMAANTFKANNTGSSAVPSDVDIATLLAAYIHGATNKATPVAADEFALIDSAASNVLKRLAYSDLLAAIGVSSGSFTPALLINGSATGITYDSRTGYYWKVGSLVFFQIFIDLSSKGASSGSVTISGLPFTVAADDAQIPQDAAWSGAATAAQRILFEPVPSTTTLQGRIMTATTITMFGAAFGGNFLANTDIGNGTNLAIVGRFKT